MYTVDMQLINILLIIQTLLLAGFCLASAIIYRKMKRNLTDFVTPETAGQASPLGLTTDALSMQLASAIAAQAKTTFMAEESAQVRGQAAVDGDIAEGVAAQNPVLGGIMSQFPALRKTLRRNPQLLDYALSKLTKPGGNNQPATGPKFKL